MKDSARDYVFNPGPLNRAIWSPLHPGQGVKRKPLAFTEWVVVSPSLGAANVASKTQHSVRPRWREQAHRGLVCVRR